MILRAPGKPAGRPRSWEGTGHFIPRRVDYRTQGEKLSGTLSGVLRLWKVREWVRDGMIWEALETLR